MLVIEKGKLKYNALKCNGLVTFKKNIVYAYLVTKNMSGECCLTKVQNVKN